MQTGQAGHGGALGMQENSSRGAIVRNCLATHILAAADSVCAL